MRLLALVLVALALRVPAMDAELGLDEILSLDMAHEAGTPWGVWTLRHDNNHRLNSLWLLACSKDSPPWVLRLPSLLAGIAAVAMARLAWNWFAALLLAGSWWPVMLSTEARGYSLAIAFALGAFLAHERYWARRSAGPLAAFWACCILAFLSHLTFLHAYLGFVAWSAVRARGPAQLRTLVLIHAVPSGFVLFLWETGLKGMHLEGGPPYVLSEVMLSLVSRGLGWERMDRVAPLMAFTGAFLFLLGFLRLANLKDPIALFFLLAVLASPVVAWMRPPPFLFERYFALPWVFFLLVVARGLALPWESDPPPIITGETPPPSKEAADDPSSGTDPQNGGRIPNLLMILLFLGGSLWTAIDFHRHQRGRLREAIAWMAEQPAPPTVAGDDDFRIRTVLGYHDQERRLTFVQTDALPPEGASWLLVHYLDASREVPEEAEKGGVVYERVAGWPSRGPADWGWFVFRNTGRRAAR